MAFKTFTAGEVLTAADVNTYLAKQAVIVCTSGTRPGSPVEGMCIFETDTDRFLSYDGTNWTPPDNVSGGTLGYAETTTIQSGITSEVDLTNLSVSVTTWASRRVEIVGYVRAASTVVDDGIELLIFEGTTRLQAFPTTVRVANRPQGMLASVFLTPTTGAHTYKLRLARFAGTGTVGTDTTAGAPLFIAVRDVGAA